MDFNKIDSPKKLLEFMSKNIKYGFIGKNGKIYDDPWSDEWNDWYEQCLVQTGDQVLISKIGTCWDQVELERLWFEKHKYTIKTIFIWFEISEPNNYPTHSFLLYEDKNNWYWFENSFLDYSGIHKFNTYKEAIDYVINKHLEHSIEDNIATIDDKKLIVAYEYSKLTKQLNVDEYIFHVTNNKKI